VHYESATLGGSNVAKRAAKPTSNDHRAMLRLIENWKRASDVAARDRVLRSYAPMVKYLAARKLHMAAPTCDLDDLVSCGLFALLRAIDSFDPAKGASFDSYAWTRVSGAIVDELRRADWAPRSLRRQERRIASARDLLEQRTGRAPTTAEVARELGISDAELQRQLHALQVAESVSLHTPVRGSIGDGSCAVDMGSTLPAMSTELQDPECAAIAGERTRVMRQAIRLLSDQEQTILSLVYVEQLTGAEAARVIGVTESRVSQILSVVRRKLKHDMNRYDAGQSSNVAA
jgi:RNA polymerase sigma factor for flagellar operon FliA